MSVRHKTTKTNTWLAWSGELNDLRRIGRLFTSVVEDRGPALWASYEAENLDVASSSIDGGWRKEDFDKRWRASAKLQDGDDEIEGPIDEVLAELDPRTIDRLEFSATSDHTVIPGDAIALVFNRGNSYSPISLVVRSSDHGWARQVLSSLSEEVEKGVPRWARWRSIAGRAAISWATYVAVYVLLLLILPTALAPLPRQIIAIGAGIVVAFAAASSRSLDWLLPPFEVRSQGTSTGGRRITALALLLVSVPVGVLVNVLTD
ncbi:hypothetical protein [Geodermatophilus sp. URMC 64]